MLTRKRSSITAAQFEGAIILVVLMLLFPPPTAPTNSMNSAKTKYGRVVFGGYDIARVGDVCLVFEGSLTEGDFFEGLEKTETTSGPTFRKKSQAVEHFPEEVLFDLKITAASCNSEISEGQGLRILPQITKSLSFKAEWKAGLQLLPAEVLSVESTDATRSSPTRAVQHYRIRLRSEKIPLTNHLVVSVFSYQDERISRISVGL